jgi:hypothetical protein
MDDQAGDDRHGAKQHADRADDKQRDRAETEQESLGRSSGADQPCPGRDGE